MLTELEQFVVSEGIKKKKEEYDSNQLDLDISSYKSKYVLWSILYKRTGEQFIGWFVARLASTLELSK